MDSIRAKESVGTMGIHILISILRDEKDKVELIAPVLETLVNCIQPLSNKQDANKGGDVGYINSEQVIRVPESIDLILGLLKEEDFYIKYNATLLLSILLRYNTGRLQESVLSCPMGVVCILDLLAEQNAVRNEALNLLQLLSSGHAEIQKICAFEGCFVHLLEILEEEGGLQGGATVKQCLDLTNGLVRENRSNQIYLRESSLLPKFVELLKGVKDASFNKQRTKNALSALETIAILSTPCTCQTEQARQGDTLELISNQNAMGKLGLLEVLSDLSLAYDAPSVSVLQAAALQALSFLLFNNPLWQKHFLGMRVEAEPHRFMDALRSCLEVSLYSRDEAIAYASNLLAHAVLYNASMLGAECLSSIVPLLIPQQMPKGETSSGFSLLEIFCSSWGTQNLQSVSTAALLLGYFVEALDHSEDILAFVTDDSQECESGRVIHFAFSHLAELGDTDEENASALHILYFLLNLCAHCTAAVDSILSNGEHPLLLFDLMYAHRQGKLDSIEGMVYRMSATLLGTILVESTNVTFAGNNSAWQPGALIDLLLSRIGIYRFFRGWANLVNDFRVQPPLLCSLFAESNKFRLTQPIVSGLYLDHAKAGRLGESLGKCKELVLSTLSTPQALMHSASMAVKGTTTTSTDGSDPTGGRSTIEQELSILRSRNASLAKELADMAASPTGDSLEVGISHSKYKGLLDNKVELEISLERIRTENEDWKARFEEGQVQLEELQVSLQHAHSEAERVKQELLQLSNTHHSLEQQNQSLRESISSLQKTRSTLHDSNSAGVAENEIQRKIEEATNAAVAAVQEEHDEALNDLLVCLGQSERGVQILSEKLRELGLDSDLLISEATAEEDE